MVDLIFYEMTKKLLEKAIPCPTIQKLTDELIWKIIQQFSEDPAALNPINNIIVGLPYCGSCYNQSETFEYVVKAPNDHIQCFCDIFCFNAAHG